MCVKFNFQITILAFLLCFTSMSAEAFLFKKKREKKPEKLVLKMHTKEYLSLDKSFKSKNDKEYHFKAEIFIPADEDFIRLEHEFDEYKDEPLKDVVWISGKTGYRSFDLKERAAPLNDLEKNPEEFIDNIYSKKSFKVMKDYYFSKKILDTDKSQELKLVFADGSKAKFPLDLFTKFPKLLPKKLERDIDAEIKAAKREIDERERQQASARYDDNQGVPVIRSAADFEAKYSRDEDFPVPTEDFNATRSYKSNMKLQEQMYQQGQEAYQQGNVNVYNPLMQGGMNNAFAMSAFDQAFGGQNQAMNQNQMMMMQNPMMMQGMDPSMMQSMMMQNPAMYQNMMGGGYGQNQMMNPYMMQGAGFGGQNQMMNPYMMQNQMMNQNQMPQQQQNDSGVQSLDNRINRIEGL